MNAGTPFCTNTSMMQTPHPANVTAPSTMTYSQPGSVPPSTIVSNSAEGIGHLSLLPAPEGTLPLLSVSGPSLLPGSGLSILPGTGPSLLPHRRVVVKPIAPKQQQQGPQSANNGGLLGGGQRPTVQQQHLPQAMNLKQPVATVPTPAQLPAPGLGTRVQPLTAQQVQAKNQSLTSHQTQARIQSLATQQTQALLASQLQSLSQAQAQALLSAISAKTYGGLEALADECLSQQHSLLPMASGGQAKVTAAPIRPSTPVSQATAMDTSDTSFAEDMPPSVSHSRSRPGVTTSKPRKPCNCRNSQCLKLYCDCFANGEFCGEGCHCCNCKNNVEHTEDRAKAVKTCLERNPNAFKPKVEQSRGNSGDERKHVKGCNCKRSGCLKNYCECYEAKIPCSNLCRCVGCKNLLDKPESKSLMQLADAADIRTQQQKAASSHIHEQLEITTTKPLTVTESGQRLPFSFINKDVAKATCLCLLEEASHALMNCKSPEEAERAVIEEFGKCIQQIITAAGTASEVCDSSSTIL